MKLWIQFHDFSSEEFGPQTFESAMERFRSFDWDSEIQGEVDAEAARDEWCQAGFGLDDEAGRLLHIYPAAGGVSDVFFRHRGSISEEEWPGGEGVPADEVEKLVRMHFAGADAGIVRALEAFPFSAKDVSPED